MRVSTPQIMRDMQKLWPPKALIVDCEASVPLRRRGATPACGYTKGVIFRSEPFQQATLLNGNKIEPAILGNESNNEICLDQC
jgi:hypothetical protein